MGPASQRGIYHKPGTENFTENWRHEFQTSKTRYSASKFVETKFLFLFWQSNRTVTDLSKSNQLFALKPEDRKLGDMEFCDVLQNSRFNCKKKKGKSTEGIEEEKQENRRQDVCKLQN